MTSGDGTEWLPGDGVSPFAYEKDKYQPTEKEQEAIRAALGKASPDVLKERFGTFLTKVKEGLQGDERVGELTRESLPPYRVAQMQWACGDRNFWTRVSKMWVEQGVAGILAPFRKPEEAAAEQVPGPEVAAAGQAESGVEAQTQGVREEGAAVEKLEAIPEEEEMEIELPKDPSLRFARMSAKEVPYEVEDLGIFPPAPEQAASDEKELWDEMEEGDVTQVLPRYMVRHPLPPVSQPQPSHKQGAVEVDNAIALFSEGFADEFRLNETLLHKGFHLTFGTLAQPVTLQQARWLQDQCLRTPLFQDDNATEKYGVTSADTWQALGRTIVNAPSIDEFNHATDKVGKETKKFGGWEAWLARATNTVVWRLELDDDDHGSNLYTLARVVTATTNVDGTLVDVIQAMSASDAKVQTAAWKEAQDTGAVPAVEKTHKFKLYNVLPVTSALQLQIYPEWHQPHSDPYNPLQADRDPVFC